MMMLVFMGTMLASASEEICGTLKSSPIGRYCIYKTEGSSNRDLLYYLHGGNSDEFGWRNFVLTRAKWKKMEFDPPVVVTISFGKFWLLAPKNKSPQGGLLENFLERVVPEVEALALGGVAKRRIILGDSMGGLNSIQLLGAKGFSIQKAAILCPAILEISPFSTPEEMTSYSKRKGVDLGFIQYLANMVKGFVAERSVWDQKMDPVAIAAERLGKDAPSIFLAGNKEDKVFFPGAEAFSKSLDKAKIRAQWVIWPGDHCQLDEEAVAEFLGQ